MMFFSWIRLRAGLNKRFGDGSKGTGSHRRLTCHLQLDCLEDRLVPCSCGASFTAAIHDAPISSPEAATISLTSTVDSDPAGGSVDVASYAWSATRNSLPVASGNEADFQFVPDDNGTYMVTLTVTDADGETASDNKQIQVGNVAPTVSVNGPTQGVPGQTLTFSLGATDPSAADTQAGFTFHVDWDGNGVVDETIPPGGDLTPSHVYTAGGVYTVKVTATDKDNATSVEASLTVTIAAVALGTDPCDSTKTALFVSGTDGNDKIVFAPVGNTGKVRVSLNGISQGIFAPTGSLVAFGQGGDDSIQVVPSLRRSAWLYGGDGNDRLKSGNGTNVLVGGNGDDVLLGGLSRDILIGGTGADRLNGGPGDDILIGGTTNFDGDTAALCAIHHEWTSQRAVDKRVSNLRGSGQGPDFNDRLNGDSFLAIQGSQPTVFDDGAADVLTGAAGRDWYFGLDPMDVLTGVTPRGIVNDATSPAGHGNH